jgi:hypothetical protein
MDHIQKNGRVYLPGCYQKHLEFDCINTHPQYNTVQHTKTKNTLLLPLLKKLAANIQNLNIQKKNMFRQ